MYDAGEGSQFPELFSAIPYFKELDQTTLEAIARVATRRTYDAEQLVFLEGEVSSGLCVVEKGWLKAIKLAPDGREQVLNFLGPNEVFNAVGVFARNVNPATVIALEASTIWIIQRDTMLQFLEEHPCLAHTVIQDLAERLLHLLQLVEDLSLRSVEARFELAVLADSIVHLGCCSYPTME